MEQKFIITIGRQYGSGGREIGKRLSQLFNIAYYDKELIKEASKESGLNAEYFEKADEKSPWFPTAHALHELGIFRQYVR